jgi:hypothetical protein
MELTEHEKQLLTEKLLGEKIHKPIENTLPIELVKFGSDVMCNCGKRFPQFMYNAHLKERNRTFTAWQDYGDCITKLIEKGWWDEFIVSTCLPFIRSDRYRRFHLPEDFSQWLINPDRLKDMAAFVEGKEAEHED